MGEGGRVMKCPIDGATLVSANRQGVAIEECPNCRGAWLGRETFDLVAGNVSELKPTHANEAGGLGGDWSRPVRKLRGSFLEDIFDF